MCAPRIPLSVSSAGSREPDQPIRSKYASALNKFDFGTDRIFDERKPDGSRGELQGPRALHDFDAGEIRERLFEIRDAPAEVIDGVTGRRRRSGRGLLDHHEHVAELERVLS